MHGEIRILYPIKSGAMLAYFFIPKGAIHFSNKFNHMALSEAEAAPGN
jgi:hypothetical protein